MTSLFITEHEVLSPLQLHSFFDQPLLPGQVPYTKHTFVCFFCGEFMDIFNGESLWSQPRWACWACRNEAVAAQADVRRRR